MSFTLFSIIAISLIVQGLVNTFGKMFPWQHYRNYTEESLQRWCRPMGLSSLIMGIGAVFIDLWSWETSSSPTFLIVGGVIALAGLIGGLVSNKKYLVKK
ncbi:MAG: hypothetical protein RSC43_02695 [Clostridia bacterium]